ncbi:MAG: NAD(P)-dependent oxidoreductase [Vicinamibacteria bacterium]
MKALRVFVTADIGPEAIGRLTGAGFEVDVHPAIEPPTYEELTARVVAGVDALVTTIRDRIDDPLLAAGACAGLQIVAQVAVGYDNVDVVAATRHGVPVANTPDVLSDATAEFAFFMMGDVARKLYPSEELVRSGRWGVWHPHHPWLGDNVAGRTVAVIGAGRIGKAFVHKCAGFDMDVLCYSRTRDEAFRAGVQRVMDLRAELGFGRRRTIEYVTLGRALGAADFVSLHVPLIKTGPEATVHFMNEARLRQMKRSAYLINTTRGPVVDEDALARVLLDGALAGAALDVFAREPLPLDSPLRDARLFLKLRLFNHLGSGTYETRLSGDPNVGMAGRAVQSVIDRLGGADPRQMAWVVNRSNLGSLQKND